MRLWILAATIVSLAACTSVPDGRELDRMLEQANTAYAEGRLDDAERLLLRVTDAHPTISRAWFRLGNIYYRTGRYPAAVRSFEIALRHDPQDASAWNNLALTRLKQATLVLDTGLRALPGGHPDRTQLFALRERLTARFGERQ